MKRKRPLAKPPNDATRWNQRLRAVLREKELTLRKAASIAGVAPSVMDSWSSGASPTDLNAVKRLCDSMEISFTWLLTGDHEKGSTPPALSEWFQETPYFDGFARIRIDRLMPRTKKPDEPDK